MSLRTGNLRCAVFIKIIFYIMKELLNVEGTGEVL